MNMVGRPGLLAVFRSAKGKAMKEACPFGLQASLLEVACSAVVVVQLAIISFGAFRTQRLCLNP
jgi:hypothetical protein